MPDDLGFWTLAQHDPDHLAVVDPDGHEVTRGELLASANQLVHALRALGLEQGDVIATVVPNGIPMLELFMAATQAGWYITPINFHLAAPEIAYIVADCEAKALFGHERFADTLTKAVAEIGYPTDRCFAIGDVPGFQPYAELKAGQPTTQPDNRSFGLPMQYTSGTTGKPKGVRRALPGVDPDLAAQFTGGFLGMFGILPHDGNVHLTVSPLYHTAVLMFTQSSMHLGHPVVLMDKWTPEGTLERIANHRVSTSHMVPTQFHRLLALPEQVRANYDVSSLRHMIHAAAPCPPEIKRRMIEWWGNAIDEYYAATEGGGTIVNAADWMQHQGTVGRAWPNAEIRIFDDDGNELAPGEIGTVYMKMANADFEYYKDKEKTDASRKHGFFTVGDVGYLDEDGWLFLRDRKTDMIISGGVNIYPAEIENELLTHPKVGDAAVFGIPHPDWGEEVKAVIEPEDGVVASPALADELLAFLADRIAGYKVPKSIDFVEALPRDPNGKLYKRKLRDPYWEGTERAI
ncbi:MAG TPA: acyl-CoA synthetase [Acidimicrobiales bacterium]|jgi:long-chain acyl-CoA synthetase|nr:acyl-CoA synthetase [Acidimicrobiales bacterium]